MGNYIPCSPGKAAESVEAQVVIPGGETRKYSGQVKVAELMLEHFSAFFVVNARSLHVGQRFHPLSADEDLELGESYIMFPMKRASSIVTADDVAPKDESPGACVTNKGSYESSLRGRDEGFESVFGLMMEMKTPKCRLSSCRSRRPSLETIMEEREPASLVSFCIVVWKSGCSSCPCIKN